MSTTEAVLSRRDEPTVTASLRDRYMADVYKRFRRVKGLTRETVASNDALRLGSARLARPARDFQFEDNARKEAAFMRWFQGALDDEVLEPAPMTSVLEGQHWTGTYVRSASQKGVEYANRQLEAEGLDVGDAANAFNKPIHQSKLRQLYRRNYTALEGITSAVDKEVSRTLSESLAEGVNPREGARRLNDRVDSVGITRARTMARTEILHSHHSHAATRYRDMGVDQVEIITYEPCQRCRALKANEPYSVDEVENILPNHPNCVCAPTPVV